MEKSEIQEQCSKCGYRQEIPGDTHISCLFDWGKASYKDRLLHPPSGDSHGIMKGWFNFPFNYDPVWMIEECKGFSKEADPGMKLPGDKFFALIALLGRK